MPDWLLLLAILSVFDAPIECNQCEQWNRPQEPFHVYGNTYYVGTGGLGSVLISTGEGLVLLDGGLPQSAEVIVGNIEKLGFRPRDIRLIGLSHAHFDHAGGISALQGMSGAMVVTSHDAASALIAGGLQENDPQFGAEMDGQTFPAVANVEPTDDGSVFEFGDVSLTLVYTPGHTWGGTSWTWNTCEEERCLDIAYVDSLTPVSRDGYRFSDGLGEVLRKTLDRIEGLDCDIMLSTHDFSFALHDKLAEGREAFVDSAACRNLAEKVRSSLTRRLNSEHR
jgi:metallo-beta-lactamase class B